MLASNRLAGTYSHQDSRPGATRLEVGPRESRAGSRVPRYTSPGPTVPATCQGGVVHAPGAPPGGGPSPTYQWKHHAPRWLTTLPRSGYARTHTEVLCSALVINNQGRPTAVPTSGSPELSVRHHRNASPRERCARGLDTGAMPVPCLSARRPARSPGAWFVARLSSSGAKVRRPFERQGGLLSIAT